MIIAAAVKFYIEKTNQEVILYGLRHDALFRQLAALGFEPKVGYKELEQGFITTDGEFLNRKQAYYHAVSCKQIKSGNGSAWLISEMLW